MQVIFGNRPVVVLLSGVLPLFCGVGVRPGIFYARRQREGREGPLRNRRLRRSAATGGGIKCFRRSRTAVLIQRCFNPTRSPIQNRGPSGPEVQAQRLSVGFVSLRLASVLKLKTE